MMRKKDIIFLISVFVLISIGCRNEHKRASISFAIFLKHFDLEIPENYHLYLILPAFSCSGCIQVALQKTITSLTTEHKSLVTIIYQSNLVIPYELIKKADILYDTNNLLDRTSMKIANPMILITENKKIKRVFYTQSDNIERFFDTAFISFLP